VVVVAWMWTRMAAGVAGREDDFAKGLRAAARYWYATELSRVPQLATLVESGERSYLGLDDAWL
jgi:butyryl-CoA dehydrogenase